MMIDIREMLKRHEGVKLRPYICPAGKKTIGVGWNMDANPLPPEIKSYLSLHGEITNDMAEELLTISILAATHDCFDIFPGFAGFSENRKAALLDFVFNIGAGKTLKFKKMLAAIKAGDWNKAANEMQDSAWFVQVGGRSKEIVAMVREG